MNRGTAKAKVETYLKIRNYVTRSKLYNRLTPYIVAKQVT